MNVERMRAETPGCAHHAHLNNAGAGLMPDPVLEAVRGHLELEARLGGYEASQQCAEERAGAYEAVGELLAVTADANALFKENVMASRHVIMVCYVTLRYHMSCI